MSYVGRTRELGFEGEDLGVSGLSALEDSGMRANSKVKG